MLFLNISLPSISGHFRFDSGQCNSAATHIFSLLGFASAFLRYSSPLLISWLHFSVAPHIQTQLFPGCASQFPCTALRFNAAAILCNSVPLQFGTERFSSVAIPCASIPLPRFAFLFNSTAFQISANPWPFHSPRNLSPAVLVPSLPNSALPFHCYSSPCCSTARPFSAKLFHYSAKQRRSLAIRRITILCPCLSNQRFSAAFPIQSGLCYSHAHHIVSTECLSCA